MKRLFVLLLLMGLAPFSTAAFVTDGLIIHLDATTLTSLADGDSVSSLADLAIGDTVDGSVSLLAGKTAPTFWSNVINGQSILRFTGANTMLSQNFALTSGGMTIFAVMQGDTGGTTAQRVANIGSPTGANGQVLGLEVSTNVAGSGYRFNNGTALAKDPNPLDTSFHIGSWQMAQGALHQTARFWVDSDEQTMTYNYPNRTVTLPEAASNFLLGGGILGGNYNDYYIGDFAEIIVYNAMLTDAQILEMNEYLSDKYAIALVPEPATLVLLGLGSLVAIRCRKA